jgi:hypothetical protein
VQGPLPAPFTLTGLRPEILFAAAALSVVHRSIWSLKWRVCSRAADLLGIEIASCFHSRVYPLPGYLAELIIPLACVGADFSCMSCHVPSCPRALRTASWPMPRLMLCASAPANDSECSDSSVSRLTYTPWSLGMKEHRYHCAPQKPTVPLLRHWGSEIRSVNAKRQDLRGVDG